MSFYKMTEDTVYVTCPCGYDFNLKISELKASGGGVILPKCPGCKKTRTTLFCCHIESPSIVRDDILNRHILNQTLLKRLIDLKQFDTIDESNDTKYSIDTINSNNYKLAKKWLKNSTLKAPLHPRIENAKKNYIKLY